MGKEDVYRHNQFQERMSEARFKFSIKCLREYTNIKPTNFAFSPLSIFEGLYGIYKTSSGVINKRLKRILYLPEYSVNECIKFDFFSDSSESNEEDSFLSSLDCENEMMCFISTNKHFVKTFMNRIRFNGGTIEYKNLSEKINCINEEIEKQIKHCICHPVKLMTIERDVIFTSAVRCKVKKFTIKCRSNAPGEPILDVKRRRNYYCKELRMYVSEFLYEEDNLSLFMLIPDSINPDKSDQKVGKNTSESDLSDLIKRLSENEGIHTLHKILNDDMKKPSELFSFWPIFEMEEDPKISELLLFLGLEEFALSDAIELNNSISGHKHSVHVDKIVHRVHVKVTREDTVAGAMTVFTTGQEVPSSSKIDTNVNCKFPFIWLLYDKLHKSILFIGTFN